MSYALSDIASSLLQRHPWMQESVSLEPMIGIVDSQNKTFHTANSPTLSPMTVVSDGVTVTPSSINYDTGMVVLSVAPTTTIVCSYTFSTLTTAQLWAIAEQGFSLAQSMLPRPWYLYDPGGGVAKVITTTAGSDVEPEVGGLDLSDNVVQTKFLVDATYVVLLEQQWAEAAARGISYREQRIGGLSVDRTKQADSYKTLLDAARETLDRSMAQAIHDGGYTIAHLGDVILGPVTEYSRDFYFHRNAYGEAV